MLPRRCLLAFVLFGVSASRAGADDPKPTFTLKQPHQVTAVAFSPGGSTLAVALLDGAVKLWDPATGKELKTLEGHTKSVNDVAFSPDGKALATGGEDQLVKVWDPAKGKELLALQGHPEPVCSLGFIGEGKTLLSSGVDGTVKLWDVRTGKECATIGCQPEKGRAGAVAVSPDGKRFAVAQSNRKVTLWDAAEGKRLATLAGHTESVLCLAFSPDGKTLASGCMAWLDLGVDTQGEVRFWDAATGKEAGVLRGEQQGPNDFHGLTFSPDGAVLATASGSGHLALWDVAMRKRLLAVWQRHDESGDVVVDRGLKEGQFRGFGKGHGELPGEVMKRRGPSLAAVTWPPACLCRDAPGRSGLSASQSSLHPRRDPTAPSPAARRRGSRPTPRSRCSSPGPCCPAGCARR